MYTPVLQRDDQSPGAVAYAVSALETEVSRLSRLLDQEIAAHKLCQQQIGSMCGQLPRQTGLGTRVVSIETELMSEKELRRKHEEDVRSLERTLRDQIKEMEEKVSGLEGEMARMTPVSQQWVAKIESARTKIMALEPAFHHHLNAHTTDEYSTDLVNRLVTHISGTPDCLNHAKDSRWKSQDLSDHFLEYLGNMDDPFLRRSDVADAILDAINGSGGFQEHLRAILLLSPESVYGRIDTPIRTQRHISQNFRSPSPMSPNRSIDFFAAQISAENSTSRSSYWTMSPVRAAHELDSNIEEARSPFWSSESTTLTSSLYNHSHASSSPKAVPRLLVPENGVISLCPDSPGPTTAQEESSPAFPRASSEASTLSSEEHIDACTPPSSPAPPALSSGDLLGGGSTGMGSSPDPGSPGPTTVQEESSPAFLRASSEASTLSSEEHIDATGMGSSPDPGSPGSTTVQEESSPAFPRASSEASTLSSEEHIDACTPPSSPAPPALSSGDSLGGGSTGMGSSPDPGSPGSTTVQEESSPALPRHSSCAAPGSASSYSTPHSQGVSTSEEESPLATSIFKATPVRSRSEASLGSPLHHCVMSQEAYLSSIAVVFRPYLPAPLSATLQYLTQMRSSERRNTQCPSTADAGPGSHASHALANDAEEDHRDSLVKEYQALSTRVRTIEQVYRTTFPIFAVLALATYVLDTELYASPDQIMCSGGSLLFTRGVGQRHLWYALLAMGFVSGRTILTRMEHVINQVFPAPGPVDYSDYSYP
ncbi:hypothetical protein EV121DRAFT_274567 [Schizophyllum commune]